MGVCAKFLKFALYDGAVAALQFKLRQRTKIVSVKSTGGARRGLSCPFFTNTTNTISYKYPPSQISRKRETYMHVCQPSFQWSKSISLSDANLAACLAGMPKLLSLDDRPCTNYNICIIRYPQYITTLLSSSTTLTNLKRIQQLYRFSTFHDIFTFRLR